MKVYILFALFIIFSNSYAQFTHNFIQTARNLNYGNANSIAIGPDGTIYLANGTGGLRAFQYNGYEFITTAYIDDFDDDNPENVAIGPDGVIRLICAEESTQ